MNFWKEKNFTQENQFFFEIIFTNKIELSSQLDLFCIQIVLLDSQRLSTPNLTLYFYPRSISS